MLCVNWGQLRCKKALVVPSFSINQEQMPHERAQRARETRIWIRTKSQALTDVDGKSSQRLSGSVKHKRRNEWQQNWNGNYNPCWWRDGEYGNTSLFYAPKRERKKALVLPWSYHNDIIKKYKSVNKQV